MVRFDRRSHVVRRRGVLAVVDSVGNLGRSGVRNWLLQRFSALLLLIYTLWILGFIASNPGHAQWQALFAGFGMRLFSSVTLLALCVHGWIGLWAVCTDYLTERLMPAAGNRLRAAALTAGVALLLLYFAYGLRVVWSVG